MLRRRGILVSSLDVSQGVNLSTTSIPYLCQHKIKPRGHSCVLFAVAGLPAVKSTIRKYTRQTESVGPLASPSVGCQPTAQDAHAARWRRRSFADSWVRQLSPSVDGTLGSSQKRV